MRTKRGNGEGAASYREMTGGTANFPSGARVKYGVVPQSLRSSMTKAASRSRWTVLPLLFCLGLVAAGDEPASRIQRLTAEPSRIGLYGLGADHGLLASAEGPDGRLIDVTREAEITSSNPKVVAVEGGRVRALADGQVEITVSYGGQAAKLSVAATGTAALESPSFRNE